MKKILSVILIVTMCLSFTACGNNTLDEIGTGGTMDIIPGNNSTRSTYDNNYDNNYNNNYDNNYNNNYDNDRETGRYETNGTNENSTGGNSRNGY